jgi:hypothetical protein
MGFRADIAASVITFTLVGPHSRYSAAIAFMHGRLMAHLIDKNLVESVNCVLLLGMFWSGLAVCVVGALSYDIAKPALALLASTDAVIGTPVRNHFNTPK